MGQYWNFLNLDDGECLSTHDFGRGLKYLEQWFSGALHTALMVLCTDTSSLGHGGGDFHISDAPPELVQLIEPVLGRWAGKRIVFAGDYTEVEEHKNDEDEDGTLNFTDITSQTAIAVWAMVAADMARTSCEIDSSIADRLLQFLNENVVSYKPWDGCKNLEVVLQKLDELTKRVLEEKKTETRAETSGAEKNEHEDEDATDRSSKRVKTEE